MAVRKHEPSGGLACVAPARRSIAGRSYERQRSGDPYRSSRVTSLPKSPKPGVIGRRRSAEYRSQNWFICGTRIVVVARSGLRVRN